ncbi:MAG: hypothetical protein CVU90_12135 [Firmicutes bacterium HGW-Firmicutes-15]|nr:MAG: hypothetical protein CVU90_12135 [Firmicutes bacterium HGW-Firmicutes-15]
MKRWLTVLLVSLFMFSCLSLVGCSKEKAANAPATTDQSQKKDGDTQKSSSGDELQDIMKYATKVNEVSFEMINTITNQGQTVTNNAKMWISNDKLRIETEIQGMKSITIKNAKGEVCIYDPGSKTAMKMPSIKNEGDLPNQWAKEDTSGMKIVGQEKMDGYDCVVVTVTQAAETSKMWLRKDIGMPVRVESKTAEGSFVIEYKNYKVGAQADNLFELPTDAQVVSMPSMPSMPGVPNMPNQ